MQRDAEPAAPSDDLAQKDDREDGRERHVELNHDGDDRGRGQRHADEHQAEMDGAVEHGDHHHIAHAAGRELEIRDQNDREDQKAQAHEQQRRHLPHADFRRDEVEAPDRADQEHEQKMLRRHGARVGCLMWK